MNLKAYLVVFPLFLINGLYTIVVLAFFMDGLRMGYMQWYF